MTTLVKFLSFINYYLVSNINIMETFEKGPISFDEWFRSLEKPERQKIVANFKKVLENLEKMPSEEVAQYNINPVGLKKLISDLEEDQ